MASNKRILSNWLDAYMQYAEDLESPKAYSIWTGISVLAGTLQRRVKLQWGYQPLYPNLFVILIGPSGRTRKGEAMGLGSNLFEKLQLPVAAESITTEALIRKMSNIATVFQDPDTKRQVPHSSLTVFSKELAVFLGQNDLKFLSLLTDWYDSHDNWVYETKGSGKDTLQGVCLNLLAATAPDWIQSMLPPEAYGGGFTSRVIFIVEEHKRQVVLIPKPPNEDLQKALIKDLGHIKLLKGSFTMSPEAIDVYKNWYMKQEEGIRNNKPAIADSRFTGYCERRATHIKKLCMSLSVSRSDELIIELEDFKRAREILESAEKTMDKTFGGLGRSPGGIACHTVLEYLIEHGETTRSIIQRLYFRDISAEMLDIVEKTLIRAQFMEMERIGDTMDYKYIYIGGI